MRGNAVLGAGNFVWLAAGEIRSADLKASPTSSFPDAFGDGPEHASEPGMHRVFRHRVTLSVAFGATALLLFASLTATDLVLFNHSPSMPIGFYVREYTDLTPGVIVTVRARDVAPIMAQQRGYDDEGDRFIKRVAAAVGDEACGDGQRVFVDGIVVAVRIETADLPLGWSGCRVLAEDEVLLLGETENSFDGRYWGPTNVALIEGAWRKL